MCRSADAMSMLPKSMDEDLEGGAKEAMKKMEGQKVTTACRGGVALRCTLHFFFALISHAEVQALFCVSGM